MPVSPVARQNCAAMTGRRRIGRGGLSVVAGWMAASMAACGGTTTVTVTQTAGAVTTSATETTAQTAVTSARELLFAVVESHTGSHPQQGFVDDTVAIVGLDGYARSKAQFTPRTPPQIGNAAPIMPPEARVVAGKVFYIDGKGVVRSLGPDRGASPSTVTTFAPPSSQVYESFAVSPDGQHLVAAVDVLTPFQTPNPSDANNPFGSGGDQDHDVIEAADSGGAAHPLNTLDHPKNPLFVGGWDSVSAIGVTNPPLGTQDGYPPGWGSAVVRLDSRGHPGAAIGPSTCRAIEGLPDGTVLCVDSDSTGNATDIASVHGASTGDWTVPTMKDFYVSAFTYGDSPHLSADGGTVVFSLVPAQGSPTPAMYAMSKGGSPKKIVDGFTPEGFLDADTVIGASATSSGPGNLAIVHLSGGGIADLGFKGLFVGVVQTAG